MAATIFCSLASLSTKPSPFWGGKDVWEGVPRGNLGL